MGNTAGKNDYKYFGKRVIPSCNSVSCTVRLRIVFYPDRQYNRLTGLRISEAELCRKTVEPIDIIMSVLLVSVMIPVLPCSSELVVGLISHTWAAR